MGDPVEQGTSRSHWLGKGIAVAVLLMTFAVAYWLGSASRWLAGANGGLVVSPEHLDLGEVWESGAFELGLPIQNVSDREIEIDGFETSCNCTKITPSRLLIPAHEAREAHLTLDLTARPKSGRTPEGEVLPAASTNARGFAITIRPKVKDLQSGRIEGWKVTARVRSAVRLNASEVSFESTSRLALPRASKTVMATDLVGVERLTVTSSSPNILVTIERPIGEDRDYNVRVRPSTRVPIGSFQAEVRIVPWLANGKELPAVTFPVSCEVVPDVQAIPANLAFGVQPIGTVVRGSFTLRSRTGSPFQVRRVQTTGERVSVSKQADATGGVVYVVQQEVVKADDQRSVITLEVRAADGTVERLNVEASHYGLSPERKWGR
jgi:hypothetical protein